MGSQGVCACVWVQWRGVHLVQLDPCPQRPYDIHSSNAVESLVQLFSTVSVQYVPTWSKEMVALLRKVSLLSLLPPIPSDPFSVTFSGAQAPHLFMGTGPFTSTAITLPGQRL